MRRRFLAAVACATLLAAAASDPSERLPDPAQEARARAIFPDVRCMVCQNESIDDSNAELAADLRRLVREQVAAGRTDEEIKAYLKDRYGEFVLMKPSFSAANLVLWAAPFLVLVFGGGLLFVRLRNRAPEDELSQDEIARLKRLQDDDQHH